MTRRLVGRCMYAYSVVVYVARVVYARHSYLGTLKDAKAARVRMVRQAKRDRSLGHIHGVVKAVMKRGEMIRDRRGVWHLEGAFERVAHLGPEYY